TARTGKSSDSTSIPTLSAPRRPSTRRRAASPEQRPTASSRYPTGLVAVSELADVMDLDVCCGSTQLAVLGKQPLRADLHRGMPSSSGWPGAAVSWIGPPSLATELGWPV